MAAHESAIGATVPVPDASNLSAPPGMDSAARRTMTQIHVFSALFWAALFTMHTTQMILANGHEAGGAIRWRPARTVLAFGLCMPLGKVIGATLERRISRRVLAIGSACLPIA